MPVAPSCTPIRLVFRHSATPKLRRRRCKKEGSDCQETRLRAGNHSSYDASPLVTADDVPSPESRTMGSKSSRSIRSADRLTVGKMFCFHHVKMGLVIQRVTATSKPSQNVDRFHRGLHQDDEACQRQYNLRHRLGCERLRDLGAGASVRVILAVDDAATSASLS